jgi:hypothetical protein
MRLEDYSDVRAIYKSVIEEYRIFLAKRGLHETLSDEIEMENFNSYVTSQSSFVAVDESQSTVGYISRERSNG